MGNKFFYLLLFVFSFSCLIAVSSPLKAEELESEIVDLTQKESEIKFKTANKFSYNLQRFTGLNFVIDKLTELSMKAVVKLKTKAKDVSVDLKTYSAWDLLRKKAKSLDIKINESYVSGIPIEYFDIVTVDPIYIKRNRAVFPLRFNVLVKVNLNSVNNVLNNLPKWKKVFEEFDLSIPPFGATKIAIYDLDIQINELGLVEGSARAKSLVNPNSGPIKVRFTGNLTLREKKVIIDNLESQIEDIFTKGSEVEKSFSKFLEDLINPVFSFHKVEKNGLKIDNVNLSFGVNSLTLEINSRLLPENYEETF